MKIRNLLTTMTLTAALLLTAGKGWGQTVTVALRPTHIDLSASTSESAVLMTLSGYSQDDARYRLYNGGNQYYCWDESTDAYITSTSYASGPRVPGTPTTSTTFWIVFQRGTNNNTGASYRDRLGPLYGTNYQTDSLPTATSITTPFTLTGTFTGFGSYDNTIKHVVLAYSGATLISAASTTLSTGVFSVVCPDGTTIDKIEIRAIDNTLIVDKTGTWSSNSNVGDFSDFTAPTWTAEYPKFSNVTPTSIDLTFNLNEPGTAYYVILANDATAPTSAEVKAGTASGGGPAVASGSKQIDAASTDYTSSIVGLTPSTSYDIYVVAEDDETTPNLQATPVKIDVTMLDPDNTPPTWTTGYPKLQDIANNDVNIKVSTNEVGKAYYIVV